MVRARRVLIGIVVLAAVLLLGGAAAATGAIPSVHPAASARPDILSDPNNCGALHFRVPEGDICRGGIATPASSCVVEIGLSTNIEVAGEAKAVAAACGDLLAGSFDGQPTARVGAPAGSQRCQVQAGAVRYTVRETARDDQVATLYCYLASRLSSAHRG